LRRPGGFINSPLISPQRFKLLLVFFLFSGSTCFFCSYIWAQFVLCSEAFLLAGGPLLCPTSPFPAFFPPLAMVFLGVARKVCQDHGCPPFPCKGEVYFFSIWGTPPPQPHDKLSKFFSGFFSSVENPPRMSQTYCKLLLVFLSPPQATAFVCPVLPAEFV